MSIEQNKQRGRGTALKGEKMVMVYLSGKMTGLEQSVYERNFRKGEEFYKACGFSVVNPCDLSVLVQREKENPTYEDYMQKDLEALRRCTHIAMLEGWETSPGARREKAEAERLGLEIMYLKFIGGRK